MDARALLESVGETYARLGSFAVDFLLTNESGDEDNLTVRTQRRRAFFVAPDKVRVERGGSFGEVVVSDGVDVHIYYRGPKRYYKSPDEAGIKMTGAFRPDFPMVGETTFLFHKVASAVAGMEVVREEETAHVLRVAYEPSQHQDLLTSSPVTFWIDKRTNLISRVEGEMTHRRPTRAERITYKQTHAYSNARLNPSIPPETFEFTAPSGVVAEIPVPPADRAVAAGGSTSFDPLYRQVTESQRSNSWKGETFVMQNDLKIRGFALSFERRLAFMGKDLKISETITGPKGATERDFSIPLAD